MRYQLTILLINIILTQLFSTVYSAGNEHRRRGVSGIRKCCYQWQGMYKSGCINMNKPFNLTEWEGSKDFNLSSVGITPSAPQCSKNVTTITHVYPANDQYRMMPNGDLEIMTSEGLVYYDLDHYCLDNYIDDKTPEPIINAAICDKPKPSSYNYTLNAYCMLASCFFILLTMGVYLSLSMYHKVSEKVLIAYLLSFFVTFLSLAILTLDKTQYKLSTCNVITFVIYFSMLAAFSWMNVMSYDIWTTISSNTMFRNTSSSSRFYWYCAYAFGVPTLLSAFLAVCEYTDIPVPIKPRLDIQKCFFDGRVKQVYLYIPILILCIANIIMFVMSAVKMATRVNEGPMNTSESRVFNRNEKRLWLYIKLFTMMGITWIFEVISSFFPHAYALWQVIDVYNLLVGPVIFVMFVCNKTIWDKLSKRFKWTKRFTSFTTRTTLSNSLKTQTSQPANKEDAANTNKTNDMELPFLNGNRNMNGTDNKNIKSSQLGPADIESMIET